MKDSQRRAMFAKHDGLFGGKWHPSAEIQGQWGVVDSDGNTNTYYYAKNYENAIKLSEKLNRLPEKHIVKDERKLAKQFR